jgi:phospholipase C
MDTSSAILPGIEHVVVVMFENRSFDNMLGGLYPEKTQQGLFNGLKPGMNNNEDPYGAPIALVDVWQAPTNTDAMIMPYPDPGELFDDMNQQIFAPNDPPATGAGQPTMGGFVYNYIHQEVQIDGPIPRPGDIMQYYKPGSDGNLPVMTALAQAYGVSDAYHASGPVQTLVNRIFAHSGQPSTYTGTDGKLYNCIDNGTVTKGSYDPLGTVNVRTIFNLLDEKFGASNTNWKIYYNDMPLSTLIKYVYDSWHWIESGGNVYHYAGNFAADVAKDSLPPYSFIEPRYTNMADDTVCQTGASYQPTSYHPGGACPQWDPNADDKPPAVSVCFGEQYLADIYNTLASNPAVFKKTLLIVTFDEHGGLYDHVPPPAAVPPVPGVANFDYTRYGVRVPAIFINPYIKPGSIFRSNNAFPYDHTSIISTICAQFGLNGWLTPRDKVAPTFQGIINSTTPSQNVVLQPLTCQVPPKSERGVQLANGTDPNSVYSVILNGMKSMMLKKQAAGLK